MRRSKNEKREEAIERLTEREGRTTEEQIKLIKKRPGNSAKELLKLEELLALQGKLPKKIKEKKPKKELLKVGGVKKEGKFKKGISLKKKGDKKNEKR